jgi:hypothetical protein
MATPRRVRQCIQGRHSNSSRLIDDHWSTPSSLKIMSLYEILHFINNRLILFRYDCVLLDWHPQRYIFDT